MVFGRFFAILLMVIFVFFLSCKKETKQSYAITTFAINNIDIIDADKILRDAEIKGQIEERETHSSSRDSIM